MSNIVSNWENSESFAKKLDKNDPLKDCRNLFHLPTFTKEPVVYYTGNSLGLQPKATKSYIQQELDDWAKWGVEGHFFAKNPWMPYHELLAKKTAKIVGAKEIEVAVTHSLTTNLHLLMVSFYKPSKSRYKILCEKKAFPSDQYALQSQAQFHGYKPEECIVEIAPRTGERLIRTEDVIYKINELGSSLAMVMIGGVNYFSGQVFEMEKITQSGQNVGAIVGFDLAHAAGNIPLELNKWNVDFAAWCTYKYLNSGPGGVSGLYINEKHVTNPEILRFAGWWGHDKSDRFEMPDKFKPIPTAESWQLSNAPVLSMAAHLASLDVFEKIGMQALREKSEKLTSFQEFIINDINSKTGENLEIITPKNPKDRGCQLSIIAHGYGKTLFDEISDKGVVADWREPNVIRIAPVPLYNSFEDAYRFGQILKTALS
ncbi:MAG: kynureninase [Flavobacteriales bacterium]|nr:kynureninase [Flavobacteriales bacterium]